MALPSPKEAERRRHPRVSVHGQAQVVFHDKTLSAGLCDASRSGARLQIAADSLDIKPNDRVIIEPKNGESSVAILCEVRHVSVAAAHPFASKVYVVGLEHVAEENNRADLLGLLLNTGVVQAIEESDQINHQEHDDRGGAVISSLRNGIRDSSRARLFSPRQSPPLLEEIKNGRKVDADDRWKVAIGIQSAAVTIEFSAYYSLESARNFFRAKTNHANPDPEDHLVHDFMREFCNLTAGAIKIWVEQHAGSVRWNKDMRVQLPVQSRGEELERSRSYHPVLNGAIQVQDAWTLKMPSGDQLVCIAEIIVRDWAAVVTLHTDIEDNRNKEKTGQDAEDDIDFL